MNPLFFLKMYSKRNIFSRWTHYSFWKCILNEIYFQGGGQNFSVYLKVPVKVLKQKVEFVLKNRSAIIFVYLYICYLKRVLLVLHPCMADEATLKLEFSCSVVCLVVMGSERTWPIVKGKAKIMKDNWRIWFIFTSWSSWSHIIK